LRTTLHEEGRVRDADERIVDLVVEERVRAAALHVGEGPGAQQRGQRAAVPVRVLHDPPGLAEQDPVVEVEARDHPLAEEEHVGFREAEALRAGEERARRRIGGRARHHVPGDRLPGARAQPADLLGLELEEAAAGDRADRERALRLVVAESRRLAAGHHEHRHATRLEQLRAAPAGQLVLRRVASVLRDALDRDRLEARRRRLAALRGLERLQQGGDVDRLGLGHERVALGGAEPIPESEHVTLAVRLEVTAHPLVPLLALLDDPRNPHLCPREGGRAV
jgi:hypothetical protein